jgi:hypothetical protein
MPKAESNASVACNMGCGANARRRHVDVARIGLRMGGEIRNRFGGKRLMYQYDQGLAHNAPNRRNVAEKVEIELAV